MGVLTDGEVGLKEMGSRILTEIIIFEHHYIYLFIALLFIGCIYFFSRRFIFWGIAKGLGYLLSFVVGTLIFMNLFFVVLVIFNQEERVGQLLPYLLQAIGLFGFAIAVGNSFRYLFRKFTEKKA